MKSAYLKFLLLIACFFIAASGWAQVKKISGKVFDENKNPLVGVSISIKGKTVAQTDSTGAFSVDADPGNMLSFTSAGFIPQEAKVGNSLTIALSMLRDVSKLGEVVVIGYGQQSRRTLSTSISKLDKKVLDNVPYSNVTQALQGTVSGVRVQTSSGQPGVASNIIVRGGTSINNPNGATPLYIVDGVIRSQIDDINSSDIESLQILKDAASTSIYGARGSNGVVIITTTTGKAGRTRVTYNYSLQNSEVAKNFDFMNAADFITLSRNGIKNAADIAGGTVATARLGNLTGKTPYGTGNDLSESTPFATLSESNLSTQQITTLKAKGWQEVTDPLNASNIIIFKETDWNKVLFQSPYTQNHFLDISGGSDKGVYDMSLGYLNGDGITIFTGYKRFTGKLNASLNLSKNFTVNSRVMYSKSTNNQVVSNSVVFNRYLGNAPTTKFLLEDGSLAPGQDNINGNPLYQLGKVKGLNENDKLQVGIDGNWTITPDLTFSPFFAIYNDNFAGNFFQQAFLQGKNGVIDNSRTASNTVNRLAQQQIEGVVTYTKSINKIGNFQAKLGASEYNRTIKAFNATGKGSPSDYAQTLDASPILVSLYSNETQLKMNSIFGRLNYDYNRKYLLTASFRYDGASNLGSDNQYGFFPGISVGWNIHEENFWKRVPKAFSTFKIRASYGVNGNLGTLGDFQAGGLYASSTAGVTNIYNGSSAVVNTQIPNAGLRWEQSKTNNIGFDLGFAKDRIKVIGDFYNKLTTNLLTNLILPSNSGFSSVLTNLGALRSKGFEFELTANVYNKHDLNVNVGANISHNVNVIEKLPYNGNLNNRIGGTQIWDPASKSYIWVGGLQEGHQIGDMFAHKQLYVYKSDADAQAQGVPKDTYVTKSANNPNQQKYGGDVAFLDADGNGIIDSKDRVYVGNIFPKYVGGFNFNASYKGFSVYVRADYSLGATIYNEVRARFIGQFQGNMALIAESAQSWKKDGDVTDVPRYRWADQTNQNNLFRSELSGAAYNGSLIGGNSRYYESGDYLCLREVTISYNFTKSLLNKTGFLSSARLYLTGSNLHYFTKYTGLNPEVVGMDGGSSLGLNSAGATGTYPVPRNFIFGINIGL